MTDREPAGKHSEGRRRHLEEVYRRDVPPMVAQEGLPALTLFDLFGLCVNEIAALSEEPRGTVLARLSRTRSQLRKAALAWAHSESTS